MAYIKLEEHLPGVTGLLEYRKDAAEPLRELTQLLLCGTNTLTEAERELIATAVSNKNECVYCTTSHAAAADAYYGDSQVTEKVKNNIYTAPVSDNLREGLHGIRGLMDFSPETAQPLNQMAEILLRSDDNTLTRGERELIGTYVSYLNDCFFCQNAHGGIAQHYLQCDVQFQTDNFI